MTRNDLKSLRDELIAHGNSLSNFPCHDDKVQILPLSSGGLMLSRAASELLIELFRGDGDVVLTDRGWLRHQLSRIGVEGGDVDLLLDNVAPPRDLAVILPFTAEGAGK